MSVNVLYFAELKEITEKESEQVTLNDLTLSELIEVLLEKYHPLKDIIWEKNVDNLKDIISVAINDSIVKVKDKLSIKLCDGDKVAFLLPMSGG